MNRISFKNKECKCRSKILNDSIEDFEIYSYKQEVIVKGYAYWSNCNRYYKYWNTYKIDLNNPSEVEIKEIQE